jgi:hypothetical protein
MTIRTAAGWIIALALAPLLLVAGRAHALVVHEYSSDYAAFAGEGCGSTAAASLRYPAGAWNLSIRRPLVGAAFRDATTDNVVAQITAATLDRDTHHARWTATGGQDACTEPGLYAGTGWETNEVYLRVNFIERVRMYFASRCDNGHYRPHTIIMACGDGNFYFTSLSWHGWNTSIAKGRGRVHENDCLPACYLGRFHVYPISVRLSRPDLCDDGRWGYTRVSWRYPGPRGPGDHNGTQSWKWACHPAA